MSFRARAMPIALFIGILIAAPEAVVWARPGVVHGLPLPKRTHVIEGDLFRSGTSFRNTVDFYIRFLKRRGLPYRAVPTYSHRGVLVARILSADPGSAWLAVHIFKSQAQTNIYIAPRPLLTAPAEQGRKAPSSE
jgi:hypothetical protein